MSDAEGNFGWGAPQEELPDLAAQANAESDLGTTIDGPTLAAHASRTDMIDEYELSSAQR